MDDFNAYIISLLDEDHEEPTEARSRETTIRSKQLMEILKHKQEDDDAVD